MNSPGHGAQNVFVKQCSCDKRGPQLRVIESRHVFIYESRFVGARDLKCNGAEPLRL